ncbi:MAG TPA: peptidylprolyl isomerase [Bryobacteraceae bacterium]|nr:peptidylprolyl isomerase [Bryobacteraceae bacterium]
MSVCGHVFLVLAAAGTALASDVKVVEQIVAKVNGEIVTATELARYRQQLAEALRQQGLTGERLEQEVKAREADVLRDKIDGLLLVQQAKQLEINVEGDVTKRLAEIQRNAKIPDQDKFHDYVRAQAGMSFEDFRQELRNDVLKQRLLGQEVNSKITVPRAEIEKYYQEHKNEFMRDERVFLSEILISTIGKDEKEIPALEKKAKDLAERARRGERFTELARGNSDSDSAAAMGAVGSFTRAQLQPQMVELVFKQERGFVTDPLRVPNGFLILRVDEKHSAGLASMEEVQNEIQQRLFEPRFEPAVREFLTRLRMDAFLEIREGFVDSGAAPGKDTTWMEPGQLKPETITKEEVASRRYRPRLLWLIPMPYIKTVGRVSSSS